MKRRLYVYSLAYPDGLVFYVGKGTGSRINHHVYEAQGKVAEANPLKCQIIRQIWAEGGQVLKTKLAYFESETEALFYERALVFFLNGLTNRDTREVIFTCAICGAQVEMQRVPGGRTPRYCSRKECQREAVRLRVEQSRAKKKQAMPRQKKAEPVVHIDNLHPTNDGFTRAYKASWAEQGITAHLVLDIVDREHWQPGQYLRDAYEVVALNPTTESGRPLGPVQEETARILQRKLRERVLDLMKVAGWQRVASTRDGQPIYQYRPAAPAHHTLSEQEVGRAAGDLEADLAAQGELQDMEQNTKVYVVYGSKEARESGAAPVFTRKVSAKPLTFRCEICSQMVTEQHYPGGRKPKYCSKPACKREAVRLRVEKSRDKKKKAGQASL